MSEIDKTKFCPDCGQSLEYLGGDGLIERSGQCEVCAGESERDRLNADRARERLTSNAWATQVATLAAERDEARDALHRRGMSVSPDLDIMRLHTQRDSARAEVAALQADLEARMTQLNEARAATVDANMALAAAADALEVHDMYIANFPDLDGCDSARRALRFAVDAARDAMRGQE